MVYHYIQVSQQIDPQRWRSVQADAQQAGDHVPRYICAIYILAFLRGGSCQHVNL